MILILLLQLISFKKHFNNIAEQTHYLISSALFIFKAHSEKESLKHSENILRNLLPIT